MLPWDQGLRCQDIHSGLRNLDPNSPLLAPLADTRIVGMAATLAGLIRGRDVIEDAQALATVAAAQLDVDHLIFNEVVAILEEADFVQGIKRKGKKITSFTETVPYYDDVYDSLGEAWSGRGPTEIEQQLLLVVQKLAARPVPIEEIDSVVGIDQHAVQALLDIGEGSGLVQVFRGIDGDLAYSPFFGFENPALLGDLVRDHGPERMAEEFDAMRAAQGLPISAQSHPLLMDAVARGLVMAPAVQRPDGQLQPFAALPYAPDATLLRARKPVVDKALAVLACLRTAQHYGGYSSLSAAGLLNVIEKLLDQNRGFLAPHGGHRRQYELMYHAGIIRFDPDTRPGGKWVTPTFVNTADNREALQLARDLITHGEIVQQRVDDTAARKALQGPGTYAAPMQTMQRHRSLAMPSPQQYDRIFEAAMGRSEL